MSERRSKNQQRLTGRNPAPWRDFVFWGCLFACLACALSAAGQGVRGAVYDAVSRNPISGARVQLLAGDSLLTEAATDNDGKYRIDWSRAGRTTLLFEADGYMPGALPELLLDGYSTITVDRGLGPWMIALNEIAVVGHRAPSTPYQFAIRTDELVRIAGHYDDPVRIAHSLPGVVLTNDQANHFSYRGQSPSLNTWMVEGLEVVNPNHLNNAGTFSDKPALSGGGVNLFSAQTLDVTYFLSGATPMQIGRTGGAVVDQHLRESAVPEWRVKAGMIGFEAGGTAWLNPTLALDGNVRYSFTGLLTSLGADFGGERIGFYDGVYSLRWQGPRDNLKVFGWAGHSDTDFDRVADIQARERFKDFFDIRYDNAIIGQGVRYLHTIAPSFSIQAGAAYSQLRADYARTGVFGQTAIADTVTGRYKVLSAFLELANRRSSALAWKAGASYLYRDLGDDPAAATPFLSESMIRPYGELDVRLGKALSLEAGGELIFDVPDEKWYPGAGARLAWQPAQKLETWLGARFGRSQRVRTFEENGTASMPATFHAQAGARISIGAHALTHNLFVQHSDGLALGLLAEGIMHMADYGDGPWSSIALVGQRGRSSQWGWEGTWRYWAGNNLSMEINQSLFASRRSYEGREPEPGRYATGYATHLMVSKEFFRQRKGKERIWHVSLRALLHGGFRTPAIDEPASEVALSTIYEDPYTLDNRLPVYKRLDLTVTRTIAGPRLRLRIALDIQNVLGLGNTAFRYYDPFLRSIEDQDGLGLIPILSVQLSGSGKRR